MPTLTADSVLVLDWTLSQGGVAVPVTPLLGDGTLTREIAGEDVFYMRDKLSQLVFADADFRLLAATEQSLSRCRPFFLTMRGRPYLGAPVAYEGKFQFTLSEVKWDFDQCRVEVTPVPNDGYQTLLETWEREVNLLDCPAPRRSITAQLDTLPTGQELEWMRADTTNQTDFIGVEGWRVFLTNTSHITGTTRDKSVYLFRYKLLGVSMEQDTQGIYSPRDLSASGWQFYQRDDTVTPPTADYVKEPEISGFKTYQIGTFDDWWHTEGGRRPKYGTDLLLLGPLQKPSDFGFSNEGYIQVTGPGGLQDGNTPGYINVRRRTSVNNPKSLWWKFGQFRFTRCFPFLDGLYYLLQQTVPQLLPPTPADLSGFFSEPTNYVTMDSGAANELPALLIAAGSDIKRFGSSEPATRLLVSLKQYVSDACTKWDAGYFIDDATGWFRIEHRSFFERQDNGLVLDLSPTSTEAYTDRANVPHVYTYLSEKLPQFEQLTVSSAVTEDFERGVGFRAGEIEYAGACVTTREGQNTTTRTASRLTGDVAGMVLSGDALPDSAIAVLAVSGNTLLDGNRSLAASELLRRYHRYGRVLSTGWVRPAGLKAGTGTPVSFASVRLSREQPNVSAKLCSLYLIEPATQAKTQVSTDGRIRRAVLRLSSGTVECTVQHPAAAATQAPPLETGQFDNSFDRAAG